MQVVQYAAKLGIRVVPEFDNPGHVRAVGHDPNFRNTTLCFSRDWPWRVQDTYKINGGPPTGVLDPSNDLSYELLQGIFADFIQLFPDNMIHLGGDEVLQSCFDESATVKDFMKANNLATYDDLVVYHMARTRYLLQNESKAKKALYWSNEDTFYQQYAADDILVYWGLADNIT